ncbi:NRPS-like enzyme [Penicillium verhagenii]|nr:NRPS-like enzyme [Penicillium verhagenii]
MENIILTHAQRIPNALAILDGSKSLTYAELVSESSHLAHSLLETNTKSSKEEPIGILLGPGINQVVAQLAVRFAGGTCVPMEPSPSLPEERMFDMLHDVEVERLIVDADNTTEIWRQSLIDSGFKLIPISLGSDGPLVSELLQQDSPPDRSHILFTSGSTGKPKAVQIRASGILHLATRTPITPLEQTDRVTGFNNPGFDLSLFEIWATLIAGATIVTVPRHIATDPKSFHSFLKDNHITVTILMAALFEITVFASPDAYRSLRHVLTAGDIANVQAMRRVLESGGPPQHLWNTYGPTECTNLATLYEVTAPETRRDRISIGRAVGDMEVYLLEENRVIYEPGKQGEICIAGPQQSLGYWKRDKENTTSFVDFPREHLIDPQGLNESQSDTVRLYRTGDLAEWRSDSGILEFIGRKDRQVKHNGFRIELGEIERVLHLVDGIKGAAVIQQPPLSTKGTEALVAFVMVDGTTPSPSEEDLFGLMKDRLSAYMVPNAVVFVRKFPLTATGKVDHNQLLQQRLQSLKEETGKLSHTATSKVDTKDRASDENERIKAEIRKIWTEMLNKRHIQDNDDFFALGGTSLQAAALIGHIQRILDCIITMEKLTRNSRLSDLCDVIASKTEAAESHKRQNISDDSKVWIGDIDLVDDIEMVPQWDAPNEGRVFLTGATGFVGGRVLHDLIIRPTVKCIACLVRGQEGVSAAMRVQRSLEKYDLWPDSVEAREKLMFIEGDLSDRTLGIGKEKFDWLANWASVIFHLGAKINFCESYREHRSSNVLGTCNMLRLAAAGRRKGFHYMSTIDVWGTTGYTLGTEAVEEDGPLLPHVQGVRFDLGYSQSQWTAESMVRRMRDRGLPITIYRPGFVIGDSDTGCSNPSDFMSRLLVGCIQMGTWPSLVQRLEYVTLDYVVNAMLHIASDNAYLGRSYCLVSPDQAHSITVEDTCRVLNDAGYPVRLVDYDDWVAQAAEEQEPDGPLAPLMPMFREPVRGTLTRWTASQYTPWYRADQAVEALRGRPDIAYRSLDGNMVRQFVKFWNRKGFYNVPVTD